MSGRPAFRLPLRPLLDHLGLRSWRDLSRRTGVPDHYLYRNVHLGVPWWQADRLAINAGTHPLAVWGPGFYEGELSDVE